MKSEKRDCTTSVRSIDDLTHLKGVHGVYIMYLPITSFIKIGRTYNLRKRHDALNTITTPHVIIGFFPTLDYKIIEKLFHQQHRAHQIEAEYFRLDTDYAIKWMQSHGLNSVYSASLQELTLQAIRSGWTKEVSKNPKFMPFKDYLTKTIGYVG